MNIKKMAVIAGKYLFLTLFLCLLVAILSGFAPFPQLAKLLE